MRPQDFEQAVLELAMTTRVPLTRANIVFYSGTTTSKADKWLDEMVRDGLIEFDTDDDGELLYKVCGASRPSVGAKELTRCTACRRASAAGSRCSRCGQLLDSHLRALKEEVEGKLVGTALRKLPQAALFSSAVSGGEKSVVLGGALGLLGPLGWFYAAPLGEAVIGSAAFFALWMLSKWLVIVLSGVLLPVSALLGALYAYKYNRTGQRSSMFGESSLTPDDEVR